MHAPARNRSASRTHRSIPRLATGPASLVMGTTTMACHGTVGAACVIRL